MKFKIEKHQNSTIFSKVKRFFVRDQENCKEFLGFEGGRCIFRLIGDEKVCEMRINSGKVVMVALMQRGVGEVARIGRDNLLWQQETDGSLHVIGEEEQWKSLWMEVGK